MRRPIAANDRDNHLILDSIRGPNPRAGRRRVDSIVDLVTQELPIVSLNGQQARERASLVSSAVVIGIEDVIP